jgi:hypothetical protein
MDTLLSWILQLHMNWEQDIWAFQNQNKIGRLMMYEDPFDLDYVELMQAIDDDSKKFQQFAS